MGRKRRRLVVVALWNYVNRLRLPDVPEIFTQFKRENIMGEKKKDGKQVKTKDLPLEKKITDKDLKKVQGGSKRPGRVKY